MRFGITLKVEEDASQRIKRLAAAVKEDAIHEIAARAVANLIRDHLADLEANHQQAEGWWKRFSPGQWPSTHWYEGARNSTQAPQQDGKSRWRISITQVGFSLQYFGGEIRPREAKMLTIPANPDTYGRRAREIAGLEIGRVDVGGGQTMLALVESSSGARIERRTKKGKVTTKRLRGVSEAQGVAFWLVRRAVISAHPGNLPSNDKMREAMNHHVRRYVERQLARRQGEVVGWHKSAVGEGYGVNSTEDLS
jgi:hypothetical protein